MKLAERLAQDVEALIEAEGLCPGDALGSEADLTERFGSSRWTLREALGLLEREGRLEIRRGRSGGIFVARPGLDSVILTLWSFLEFIAVSDEEILDARAIVDRVVLTLAAERLQFADVASLRAAIDLDSHEQGLQGGIRQFEALLESARNPLAAVLVKAIGQLGLNATLRSNLSEPELVDSMRQTRKVRREQIEAVIGGDVNKALALEARTLREMRKLLESARTATPDEIEQNRERALRVLGEARRYKRPELLMHEIAAGVVAQGLPPGTRLGGEADLLARYKVSRAVFREAVRALERSGIVEMRAGRHSGLFAVAPDPTNTLAMAQGRIAALGLSLPALADVFSPVMAGAIAMISPQKLCKVQPREDEGEGFLSLCKALARTSGNRILGLFVALLADLLAEGGIPARLDAHYPLLRAACTDGDAALVARVMINALKEVQSATT